MMVVSEYNVPVAFAAAINKMAILGDNESSRNGFVRVVSPAMLEIRNPAQRVLFDPIRDANPFFHVAEFVWMMSGSNNVNFIEFFNSRMREYADSGTDTHHGAYGYRWRAHFGRDQILRIRDVIRRDPNTRRAVLGMWDPRVDLESHNDLPCNTHIYFRVHKERLDMTVCNRSNDLVWGMLGANAVHMTLLHELLAGSLDMELGVYRAFTNNLHIYESVPNFEVYMSGGYRSVDKYGKIESPRPVLQAGETLERFLKDCEDVVAGSYNFVASSWLRSVAIPMIMAYEDRKNKGTGLRHVRKVTSEDWRIAAEEWVERRELAKTTAEV